MPLVILYREVYGNSGREMVFIKSAENFVVTKVEQCSTSESKNYGTSFVKFLKEVFLPQGFPYSVHSDYLPYQIWDTVQAFASTIMGTLTTHSIMQGVGVGESSATALAAAITWILKDGTGMIGRIVFTWWNGPGLDMQCKKWRLFADILNDCAMGIELTLPYFSNYSILILCISTAMKSIVGVAGSATRAAITQHQALRNNLGDVSAKDGSQETFVNLIASFMGILILSNIGDGRYIMELFVLLAIVHLYANYRAVKSLCLNSLNEERLALIMKNYLINRCIPDPSEVNKLESVLLFKNASKSMFGFNIKMGVSLESVFQSDVINSDDVQLLSNPHHAGKYLIMMDVKRKIFLIPVAKNVQPAELLRAYFHASLYGLLTCMALRWPVDILLKARTYEPSYLLMRMYLLNKKYLSLTNRTLSSIPIKTILAADELIATEYQLFEKALQKSVWLTAINLLPVGQWRGSWMVQEDEELSSETHIEFSQIASYKENRT